LARIESHAKDSDSRNKFNLAVKDSCTVKSIHGNTITNRCLRRYRSILRHLIRQSANQVLSLS